MISQLTQVISLDENAIVDHALQQRYGFQFAGELEGHDYSIKCVQGFLKKQHAKLSSADSLTLTDRVRREEEDSLVRLQEPGILHVASVDTRTVRLWDGMHERKRILFPAGKAGYFRCILFIPSKLLYVAATTDLTFNVYNLNLVCVGTIKFAQRSVYSLKFNANSSELISVGGDGVTIWTWKEEKKEEWDKSSKLWKSVTHYGLTTRTILQGTEWAQGIRMDHERNWLFVFQENSLAIFDAGTGTILSQLSNIHTQTITDAVFFFNSHYIVTSCMAGDIKVWSKARNNSLVHVFNSHNKAVTKLELHPEEPSLGLLISCSLDRTVRVFSLESLIELYKLVLTEPCHSMELLYDPEISYFGAYLLLLTGNHIQTWKLNHMTRPFLSYKTVARTLQVHPKSAASLTRDTLLSFSADGLLRLVDLSTREIESRIIPNSEGELACDFSYSSETQTLFTLDKSGCVSAYLTSQDPAPQLFRWEHKVQSKDVLTTICLVTVDAAMDLFKAKRMAGRRMLTAKIQMKNENYNEEAEEKEKHVDDSNSLDPYRRPAKESQRRLSLCSSPDLSALTKVFLVGGTANGGLYFWDATKQGTVRAELWHAHMAKVEYVRFDASFPKFPRLITCSSRNDVKVWDLTTLEVLHDRHAQNGAKVTCIEAFPTAKAVLIGYSSGEIELLDCTSLKSLTTNSKEHHHSRSVTAAACNHSLKVFLTAGEEGTIKVWDWKMNLLRELDIHGEPVRAMTLVADDAELLIGERDAVVSIPPSKYLPAYLHAVLDGSLTLPEEHITLSAAGDGVEERRSPCISTTSTTTTSSNDGLDNYKDHQGCCPQASLSEKSEKQSQNKLAEQTGENKKLSVARRRASKVVKQIHTRLVKEIQQGVDLKQMQQQKRRACKQLLENITPIKLSPAPILIHPQSLRSCKPEEKGRPTSETSLTGNGPIHELQVDTHLHREEDTTLEIVHARELASAAAAGLGLWKAKTTRQGKHQALATRRKQKQHKESNHHEDLQSVLDVKSWNTVKPSHPSLASARNVSHSPRRIHLRVPQATLLDEKK